MSVGGHPVAWHVLTSGRLQFACKPNSNLLLKQTRDCLMSLGSACISCYMARWLHRVAHSMDTRSLMRRQHDQQPTNLALVLHMHGAETAQF